MKVNLILLILLSPILIQCKKPSCLESSGATVIIKRRTQPFSQIHLYDNINLVLKQDEIESIEVEAGQNLQPNISISVENDILKIRNNSSCKWLKRPNEIINVYVSLKALSELYYHGSGKVSCTNMINTNSFFLYSKDGAGDINLNLSSQITSIHLEGSSLDVVLHGKSNYLESLVNSRGTIDFSDFEVNTLKIRYASLYDGVVNVKGDITANIFHSGNIYYKGNPLTVNPAYYSSGRLIKAP